MGQVIPRQHPAVVLKSHYKAVRALLAAALIAIAALSATLVIVANDDDNTKASSQPVAQQAAPAGTRFDGGPNEGTRGISTGAGLPPGTRFDGGPDEGTRGAQAQSYWQQSSPRTSYQPQADANQPPAGMAFKQHAGGPRFVPMGPSN